jgi:hypothetical protein
VLFGDNGVASVKYEVDAFHDELGIAVEVDAERGAKGTRTTATSSGCPARYVVLMMPTIYRYISGSKRIRADSFAKTREQLSAIYASTRLRLPSTACYSLGIERHLPAEATEARE